TAGYPNLPSPPPRRCSAPNGGVDLDQSANTLTFDVTSVNDAPSGANNTVSLLEDGVYTVAAADFGFSDVADGNALQAVKITTLPANGRPDERRVGDAAGQQVSAADINHGPLK